jgi:drug/metabolite transporter (DMT)-like permease
VGRHPLTGARVWLALLVVYVVWGSTYLGILLTIRTIPVLLAGALRFLIAGALLYAWSIRRGDRTDRPGRRQWLAAGVVGLLLFLVGNTGVAWGELHVATGIASLVIATVPLWMALLDRIGYGQRLGRAAIFGLALGFGGAALLAAPTGTDKVDLAGIAVLFFSAAGWAAGSLYSRRAPQPRRPLVSSSMQMLVGGAILLLFAAGHGDFGRVHHVSTESILALVYLIVFGSILAFSAYAWLLRVARTSLVSTYAYVNPLVAVFLGWGFENETISGRTIGAGALILAAVALIVGSPRTVSEGTMPWQGRGEARGDIEQCPAQPDAAVTAS